MTAKTTAQILRDAADVIERNGWWQGDLYDTRAEVAGKDPKGCPVCLLGAINIAVYDSPKWDETPSNLGVLAQCADQAIIAAVDHLIDLYAGTDMEPILPDWNDAPSRTQDEVTAFLRAAADKVGS